MESAAYDQRTGDLWLLSLVGSQSNLKAIFANLVKAHPVGVRIMEQDDPLGSKDQRPYTPCQESLGTWHMRTKKLPCGKYHGLLFTRMSFLEPDHNNESFFPVLARTAEDVPLRYWDFLNFRLKVPMLKEWADYLWWHGDYSKQKHALVTIGELHGYAVKLDAEAAEEEICNAVRKELLHLPDFLGGNSNGQTGSTSESPVLSHA